MHRDHAEYAENRSADAFFARGGENLRTITVRADSFSTEQSLLQLKTEDKLKYCIECSYGTIDKTVKFVWSRILSFPTKEMRNVFYENFKDLIEQCKELL